MVKSPISGPWEVDLVGRLWSFHRSLISESPISEKAVAEYALRNRLLERLGYADYSEYLLSDLWIRIRDGLLLAGPTCYGCADQADQVHHLRYSIEVLRGDRPELLVPICEPCHMAIEYNSAGTKLSPSEATADLERLRSKYR